MKKKIILSEKDTTKKVAFKVWEIKVAITADTANEAESRARAFIGVGGRLLGKAKLIAESR